MDSSPDCVQSYVLSVHFGETFACRVNGVMVSS